MFSRWINLRLCLIILKVAFVKNLGGSLLLSILYIQETRSSEVFYIPKVNTPGFDIHKALTELN